MTRCVGVKAATMAAVSGLALATAAPGLADDRVDLILDMRLRGETVEQDGFANDAEALTLRTRLGAQATLGGGFSILVEGENVLHLVDDFNSTVNGQGGFPVVADPEATELNRAQIAWTNGDGFTATLGRQRLILGDARYVGNVGFRQNEQTFDAAVFNFQPGDKLDITYAYLAEAHRIFGDDSPVGDFDLDAHALWTRYQAGSGALTGFAILSDFQDADSLSTATYGVNWSGSFGGGEGQAAWRYMLEYAVQSDYADNPRSFNLGIARAEISVTQNGVNGRLGVEQLEGDGRVGFLTPLATLHKFQGWADAFLATPANGIRDIYVGGGYTFPEAPFGAGLSTAFAFHDYESENGAGDLGTELDAVITSRFNDHVALQLKAAFFNGGASGPADRDKIWFGVTFQR